MPSLVDVSRIPVSSDSSISLATERNIRCNSILNNQRGSRKLQELKTIVEKAIQNHKTFTVLGPFTCIKHALKLRGWIEKFESKQRRDDPKYEKSATGILQETNVTDSSEASSNQHNENMLDDIQMSRLLRDYSVDFIWTMKNEPIKWKRLNSRTLVSRFARAEFTTKAGLCSSLQQFHWFCEDEVSMILFPRCYITTDEDELAAFVENFRLTACVGLVRLICENSISEENIIFQKSGKIPISSIEFALKRCKEYVSQQQHLDIDQRTNEKIWDHQWDQFLTCYYQLVHEDEIFACESDDEATIVQEQCQDLLTQLADYWPQLHLDGTNNLWILKPAAKSRGRGIHIMKRLEDILVKVNSQQGRECRYVAQKYIERPLLIYDTKFDIRQWFLITSTNPLTVWMYKESYLRFCSQAFTLLDTHESVHLSNNAVQCKYANGIRDRNLPDENMWDCYTFQTYLRSKGKAELWDTIIYPGMRKNIIGTLLASQDTLDTRKGCFELFGADFMLSETFEPWLIEINSGPSMSASTSVTARMCAQVLDDVIKVVIDRKHDKNANTGMFELAYKQIMPPVQPYMGQNLVVRGSKIEDGRTKASKRRLITSKPKKRKLSNASVPIRSLQSNKQLYAECGRRFRAAKSEQRKASTSVNGGKSPDANKYRHKESMSKREISNATQINLDGGVLENVKRVLEEDALLSSKEHEKSALPKSSNADPEIHQYPLPVVGERAKCVAKPITKETAALRTINGATKILPPIEIPSR